MACACCGGGEGNCGPYTCAAGEVCCGSGAAAFCSPYVAPSFVNGEYVCLPGSYYNAVTLSCCPFSPPP